MHKTVRMQEITPAVAKRMLDTMQYDRQRRLRLDHVHFLADEMKAKRFTDNTLKVCVLPGGTEFLVNGYHTLHAIIESGTNQQLPVEFFNVKARADIDRIYARTDRQLKRTRTDTIRVYGLEDAFDLPPSTLSRFAAASVVVMRDFSSGGGLSYVSDDEVVLFMMEWLEPAKQFLSYVKESPLAGPMTQRHVFPAGLVTTRYSKKAEEFWTKAATDDALSVGDPRKTIHNWLKDTGLTKDSSRRRNVTLPLGLRAVANAWNAFVEERPLHYVRVTNTTLPVVLRETPYDPRWHKK